MRRSLIVLILIIPSLISIGQIDDLLLRNLTLQILDNNIKLKEYLLDPEHRNIDTVNSVNFNDYVIVSNVCNGNINILSGINPETKLYFAGNKDIFMSNFNHFFCPIEINITESTIEYKFVTCGNNDPIYKNNRHLKKRKFYKGVAIFILENNKWVLKKTKIRRKFIKCKIK